jgi:hypothetical protein
VRAIDDKVSAWFAASPLSEEMSSDVWGPEPEPTSEADETDLIRQVVQERILQNEAVPALKKSNIRY